MSAVSLRTSAAALFALAALVAAGSASGQSKPAPGCAGLAAEDAPGDQTRSSPAGGPSVEGPEYLDITGLFFVQEGTKYVANMKIANLTASPDPGTATRWYVVYKYNGKEVFVRGAIAATGELTFSYGDANLTDVSFTVVGETTGELIEGADGIVKIVVPSAVGGKAGAKLVDPVAITFEAYYVGVQNALAPASDRAPDGEAFGKTYDAGLCESGGTPPPPSGGTPPPPSSGQPGPAAPAPTEQAVQKGALKVSLAGRAKRGKGKAVPVGLRSQGTVTGIDARLFKGKKVVGKGRLARLAGKGAIKLKVSKKLKKGKYKLLLVGTNPDGRKADKTLSLKLR